MAPIKNRIHPEVKIGHVHLTVSDLERSLKFYRDLLGFEITSFFEDTAVFLSAGGYHQHIALNTWKGKDATPPPPGHTGLYHFAILFPDRRELARMLKILYELNYPIEGATDNGVSESVYISDPDGNGIEIYCDRSLDQWPIDEDGHLQITTKPLDILDLLSEMDNEI
jgi:catechol 2,3-dioxygenase